MSCRSLSLRRNRGGRPNSQTFPSTARGRLRGGGRARAAGRPGSSAAQADPQAIQRLLNRLLVRLVVVRITGIGFVREVRNATPMPPHHASSIKIRARSYAGYCSLYDLQPSPAVPQVSLGLASWVTRHVLCSARPFSSPMSSVCSARPFSSPLSSPMSSSKHAARLLGDDLDGLVDLRSRDDEWRR